MKKWISPVGSSLSRKLKSLPSPLAVSALIFGMAPLISLLLMRRPLEIIGHEPTWKAAVLIFDFWIGPLALAGFALTRHKYLIPLFLVECATMVLCSFIDFKSGSAPMLFFQICLIAGMSVLSFFLLRTDALIPLMLGTKRAWRNAPRMEVGLVVTLFTPGRSSAPKVTIENVSATGMEISGSAEDIRAVIGEKKQKDQFDFFLVVQNRKWEFSSDIAWTRHEDGEKNFGLRITDRDLMEAFIATLPRHEEEKHPLVLAFAKAWESKPFRQVALSVWAIIILGAFVVTSVHTRMASNDRGQNSNYIKAGFVPVEYRPK